MQLSRRPVGHGIVESSVESGSLQRHPLKRTRTTLSYIMIALYGTDDERAALRRDVNRQHRSVRSSETSPVDYDAFDPQLQLWVAACMYRGLEDAVHFLHGSPSEETSDALYAHASRFATTLQVPASAWPKDRAAFERYWRECVADVAMDETTRAYLRGIASLDFLPRVLRVALAPAHRLITVGFLPVEFRHELGLAWNPRRARLFQYFVTASASLDRVLPARLREFPWNLVWWDARRRIRRGRSLV